MQFLEHRKTNFILQSDMTIVKLFGCYNQELIADYDMDQHLVLSQRNNKFRLVVGSSDQYDVSLNTGAYLFPNVFTELTQRLAQVFPINLSNNLQHLYLQYSNNRFRIEDISGSDLFYRLGFSFDASNNYSIGAPLSFDLVNEINYKLFVSRQQYPEVVFGGIYLKILPDHWKMENLLLFILLVLFQVDFGQILMFKMVY